MLSRHSAFYRDSLRSFSSRGHPAGAASTGPSSSGPRSDAPSPARWRAEDEARALLAESRRRERRLSRELHCKERLIEELRDTLKRRRRVADTAKAIQGPACSDGVRTPPALEAERGPDAAVTSGESDEMEEEVVEEVLEEAAERATERDLPRLRRGNATDDGGCTSADVAPRAAESSRVDSRSSRRRRQHFEVSLYEVSVRHDEAWPRRDAASDRRPRPPLREEASSRGGVSRAGGDRGPLEDREEVSRHRDEVTPHRDEVSRRQDEVFWRQDEAPRHRDAASPHRDEVSRHQDEVSRLREEVLRLREGLAARDVLLSMAVARVRDSNRARANIALALVHAGVP